MSHSTIQVSSGGTDPYCGQERGENLAEDLPPEDDGHAHAVLHLGPHRVAHVHDKVLGQLRRPREVELRLVDSHEFVSVTLRKRIFQ